MQVNLQIRSSGIFVIALLSQYLAVIHCNSCSYVPSTFVAAVTPMLGYIAQTGPKHMPRPEENEQKPNWMSDNTINYGVIGQTGAGISGLINGIREIKRGEPGFAPEDVKECTKVPTPYKFGKAVLYDMPGMGTLMQPRETYGKDAGLRWLFGAIICVKDGRPGQDDAYLVEYLEKYNVTYYVVNNRCKNLIRGELESWMSEDDAGTALKNATLVGEYTERVRKAVYDEMIRAGAEKIDYDRIYCIDSRDLAFGHGPRFTKTAITDLLSHTTLVTFLQGNFYGEDDL
jgi:hypothetical protein